MESNEKLVEKERHQRLVEKLICLSYTRPNIAFVVSVVSQHMHSPKEVHLKAMHRILRCLKGSIGKQLFFIKIGERKIENFLDVD